MNMKKYQVGVKIFNTFEVEASSEEDAEEKVRKFPPVKEMLYKTLMDCDFNITYVDEIKGRDIPREMCEDLLVRGFDGGLSQEDISGLAKKGISLRYDKTITCDDEHGNTLGGYPTGSVDFGTSFYDKKL